jgi:hypothetical protein
MVTFLRIVVGLGVLALGRQLFWLFVGGVGFVFGINLATRMLEGQSDQAILIIALIIGVIGAVFALFLQRLAVGIAGFLGGSVIAINLLNVFNLDLGSTLVPFILGGIIGLILVSVLFDWALIVISSFTGATFIVQSLNPDQGLSITLLLILLIFGIVVQASQMRRESRTIT